MTKVKVILYPGASIKSSSRKTETTLVVSEGTTIKDLHLLFQVTPGTVVSIVDKRVLAEGELVGQDNVVEFYPVCFGG
jgi:hypothetical protein